MGILCSQLELCYLDHLVDVIQSESRKTYLKLSFCLTAIASTHTDVCEIVFYVREKRKRGGNPLACEACEDKSKIWD